MDKEEAIRLLDEIINKVGPYKMDNYEHAISVMNNSSENAQKIKDWLLNEV